MSEVITEIQDLVNRAEIADVVFHEVCAKRSPESAEAEDELSMQIMAREDGKEIGIRLRATVVGGGGQYMVDAEGIFELATPAKISPEILSEFIEKVGVMVVYPYVREAINDAAARLCVTRPVLKLLRQGDVRLADEGSGD